MGLGEPKTQLNSNRVELLAPISSNRRLGLSQPRYEVGHRSGKPAHRARVNHHIDSLQDYRLARKMESEPHCQCQGSTQV